MIYFKLVPISGQNSPSQTKFLTLGETIGYFFMTPLEDTNHEDFLKKELKTRFGIDFLISRSFYVINKGQDIYIYTFVIPSQETVSLGKYMTAEEIINSPFNHFDKLAIKDFYQKSF